MAIKIIHNSPTIEALLVPYKEAVGKDYEAYRNHIYRVLTYALHYLGPDHPNRREVEAALVFHDIGLWTACNLAYLEPSIIEMDNTLSRDHPELNRDIIGLAIYHHHKIFRFRGPHKAVVNAVRKADWIDSSQGLFRKGISRADIRAVETAIPNAGFHEALERLCGSLNRGNKLGGAWQIWRRVYRW
ncbi:MAG: hypothetical protein ACPGNV_11450 [Mangrovicoccus sp.]